MFTNYLRVIMSTPKSIQQLLPPPPPHPVGDGFRVHTFFPGGRNTDLQRMSPFFLLDYNAKIEFPPSATPRGVGVHPHRGFETVTIAYHGRVAHHDSAGNSGVIGEGDVQWMTAGSGILHKEYHEAEFSRTGGPFQMVQLWVNLPARFKMNPPKYQGLRHEQLGTYALPGDVGVVEVIAGEYRGVRGPASTFSPIEVYNGRVKRGATVDFSLPAGYNTGLLVIEGSLRLNGTQVASANHFVLFNNDGSNFTVEALDAAVFLVLSGQPLHEPIVAHGPYLMNTQEEIRQAMRDFGSGKFGQLA